MGARQVSPRLRRRRRDGAEEQRAAVRGARRGRRDQPVRGAPGGGRAAGSGPSSSWPWARAKRRRALGERGGRAAAAVAEPSDPWTGGRRGGGGSFREAEALSSGWAALPVLRLLGLRRLSRRDEGGAARREGSRGGDARPLAAGRSLSRVGRCRRRLAGARANVHLAHVPGCPPGALSAPGARGSPARLSGQKQNPVHPRYSVLPLCSFLSLKPMKSLLW